MAIYSFRASIVKRSDGRSSVAAAAYRAGERLVDERTGTPCDYTQKGGVLHAEIIAPSHAPDWVLDRATLWNSVEARETRINSQVAREFTLALPHELNDQQREELVRSFLEKECVSRGMVADFAIHLPDRDGDQRNHHAHVLLTLREITPEGFSRKAREWNDPALLSGWREQWAEHTNAALERAGRPERVDHRTLEAQGEDREPTLHEGPDVTVLAREGARLDAAAANENKRRRNAERSQLEETRAILTLQIERPELARTLKAAEARKPDLAEALSELKAADHSDAELNNVRREIAKERRALYGHDKRQAHLEQLDQAVAGGFESTFRDPGKAQRRFIERCASGKESPAQVARALKKKPSEFGALKGRQIAILWKSAERKEALRTVPILAEKARKAEYLRRKIELAREKRFQTQQKLEALSQRLAVLEKRPNPDRLLAQRKIQQAARGLSHEAWNGLSWEHKKDISTARRAMRDDQARQFADRALAARAQYAERGKSQGRDSQSTERERARAREQERQERERRRRDASRDGFER
mgnify:CR=1 FL=1